MHALSTLSSLLIAVRVPARKLGTGQKIQPVLPRQLGRLRPSARGVMVGKRESCQSRLVDKWN